MIYPRHHLEFKVRGESVTVNLDDIHNLDPRTLSNADVRRILIQAGIDTADIKEFSLQTTVTLDPGA
jgi:hypothetical protein